MAGLSKTSDGSSLWPSRPTSRRRAYPSPPRPQLASARFLCAGRKAFARISRRPTSQSHTARPTPSGRARLRAGPRVVQAHPRELERRRHHLVPERPHVRRRVERDLGRRVPTDQVVDREPLERIDYGTTHPIPRGLGILREGLSLKAIDVEPCFPDAVEPPLLDDMDPPLAPTTKEPCDVSLSRPRSSPERAPRAITREPVEGQMPSVDRPD